MAQQPKYVGVGDRSLQAGQKAAEMSLGLNAMRLCKILRACQEIS
jgi:hypothetical protein